MGYLLVASGSATAALYSIGTNFTGSDSDYNDSFFIPPDTMGAVGPNHIGVLINGRWSVYNKNTTPGSLISGMSLNNFWSTKTGVTPSGSFAFDPRIIYDNASGRWFAAAVDNAGAANNFLVAVSATNDPTGSWSGFKIDSDTDNVEWADFPMMGVNQDAVVISANMFPVSSGGTSTSFLVLPKSDLLAGSPTVANRTLIENQNLNNTGFAPQPVFDYTNSSLPLPILSAYNKPAGSLKTSSITGTAASPTLSTAGGFITVTGRNSPPDIDQPGAKVDIDAGDNRFSGNVIMQQHSWRTNPSLWAAHSVEISGRAAIEWYEIDATTNALLQSGTISDPSLAFNYPTIAVNEDGDVVIGYSGGDPSTFISTYVSVGETNTTTGVTTFDSPDLTKAGLDDYQRLDSIGRNRWGDYSATVLDPSNDKHFWTFQEFVLADNVWAVQVTEIVIGSTQIPLPGASAMGLAAMGLMMMRRRPGR
ncbi:hypothetical protein HED60_01730 [Planctomycetales bacterium ZRK34]|nr:hypothetical protein HED60_01730 [Planctomycetales bacterium ZRK34]